MIVIQNYTSTPPTEIHAHAHAHAHTKIYRLKAIAFQIVIFANKNINMTQPVVHWQVTTCAISMSNTILDVG